MEVKKFKKIFIIIFFLLTCTFVLSFYFFCFYLPLQENKELFPNVNKEEIVFKELISEELKEKYGVTYEEIKSKDNIYFIDGREKEEYDVLRIKKAIHLRTQDILSVDDIINALGITFEEFQKSLIVIYCHDGHRGSEVASEINLPNVKFLIDGRKNFLEINSSLMVGDKNKAPFPDYIKNQTFVINIDKAENLLNEGAFLIDGRLYENDNLFPSAFDFRIGQMSTEEYNNKLKIIIEQKNNNIIFIANIYPDLFYAKLLIYRLERDYGFDYKKFHIILGQDDEFSQIIKVK